MNTTNLLAEIAVTLSLVTNWTGVGQQPLKPDRGHRSGAMKAEMITLFDKCVIQTRGGRSIRCCLGLWSVSTPDAASAEREGFPEHPLYVPYGTEPKEYNGTRH